MGVPLQVREGERHCMWVGSLFMCGLAVVGCRGRGQARASQRTSRAGSSSSSSSRSTSASAWASPTGAQPFTLLALWVGSRCHSRPMVLPTQGACLQASDGCLRLTVGKVDLSLGDCCGAAAAQCQGVGSRGLRVVRLLRRRDIRAGEHAAGRRAAAAQC